MKQLILSVIILLFSCTTKDQPTENNNNCNAEVCLTLNSTNIDYISSENIYGFQFTHNGCVTNVVNEEGDAAAYGFTITSGNNSILAFSFSASFIPSGTGTLIELEGNIIKDCLSEFIISGFSGNELSIDWN